MSESEWDNRACECYSSEQCTEIFNISEFSEDPDIVA